MRPGYDAVRHQVSLLSLGERGWVEVASFIATGLLLIAFARGLRAALSGGQGAAAGPIAVGLSGLGFVTAGVFSTVPSFGFPPGAPGGLPADLPASSYLHVVGAVLLFSGLIAAALVLARRFQRGGGRAWARYSTTTAVIVFVFFGLSGGGPSGELLVPSAAGLLQRVALIAGLGWLVAIALRELRRTITFEEAE